MAKACARCEKMISDKHQDPCTSGLAAHETPMQIAVLVSIADLIYGFDNHVLDNEFIRDVREKMHDKEAEQAMELCMLFSKQVIGCLQLNTGEFNDNIEDLKRAMKRVDALRQGPGKYRMKDLLKTVPPGVLFGVMLWLSKSMYESYTYCVYLYES